MNPYRVGQRVEVFSFGRWYLGTVTSVGTSRVKVLYKTGSGAERDKAFHQTKVRELPDMEVSA
jgi:hypothetical protein